MEGVACPISWASGPSSQNAKLANILKILPGKPTEVLPLSPFAVGVWTHYVEAADRAWGRTLPCTMAGGSCMVDHSRTSARVQWWMAVQKPGKPMVYYVALTEACVRDFPEIANRKANHRGKTLLLQRAGEDKRSAMQARWSSIEHDQGRLLPEPDVIAFLFRLWGIPMGSVADQANANSPNRLATAEIPAAIFTDNSQALNPKKARKK